MEDNKIRIISRDGFWCVHYIGPHGADVIRQFGTDVMATAYKVSTDKSEVMTRIQLSHRDCKFID